MNEYYYSIQILASAYESLKKKEKVDIAVGLISELLLEYKTEQEATIHFEQVSSVEWSVMRKTLKIGEIHTEDETEFRIFKEGDQLENHKCIGTLQNAQQYILDNW